MYKRIRSILFTFYQNNCDIIYLGAFGCGVFRNDPIMVAKDFKALLNGEYKNCFKKVIFPVPKSDHDRNYSSFHDILIGKNYIII